MKFVVFSCLAVLVFNTAAEDKVNLCGSELAKARVFLCFGNEYLLKRSPVDAIESKEYEDRSLGEPRWVWRSRHAAQAAARWSRNKRGLVDECCLKPCTTDVILSYC